MDFVKEAWVADGYKAHAAASKMSANKPSAGFIRLGCNVNNQRPKSAGYSNRELEEKKHVANLLKKQQDEQEGYGPQYFSYMPGSNLNSANKRPRPWSAPANRKSTDKLERVKAKLGYATFSYEPPMVKRESGKFKPSRPLSACTMNVQPPTADKPKPRPASATCHRIGLTEYASPDSTRPTSAVNPRAMGSQSSSGRIAADLRKSYTLINRAYEEEYYQLETYASACPDNTYMNRHARCFDHTQVHQQLLRNRPQRPCENCGIMCEHKNICQATKPKVSAAWDEDMAAENEFPYTRYTNALRPKSAPSMKRGGYPLYNNITRGTIPHFCNFVKKVKLKGKDLDKQTDHSPGDLDSNKDLTANSVLFGSTSHDSTKEGDVSGRRTNSPASDLDRQTDWPHVGDEDVFSSDNGPGSGDHGKELQPETQDDHNQDIEKSSEDQNNVTENNSLPEPQPPSPPVEKKPLVPPPPLPTRPPPQPQSSPYPHQNVPVKKPRAPIQKKEKKPFERKKSEETKEVKQEEEVMEEIKPEVKEEVKAPEPPALPKPKVDVGPPDLPQFKGRETRRRKGPSKKGKEGIKFLSPFDDPNTDKDTLDSMKDQRKAFEFNMSDMAKDDLNMQKPRIQSWLQGRLALSQQSSRFELPMDMKTLESMTGEEYLKKYCIISHRRQGLYHKVHNKYKDRSGTLTLKDMGKALQEVLINTITQTDITELCNVIGLKDDSTIDYKLFSGIAAVAERMLYPKFVTDDTADLREYKKETIECADFSALDWKLHGLDINPQVRTILKTL